MTKHELIELCAWFLEADSGSAIVAFIFRDNVATRNQRIGQAFMNSLNPTNYNRLTGTLIDPFYKDENIVAAIDRLCTKERVSA